MQHFEIAGRFCSGAGCATAPEICAGRSASKRTKRSKIIAYTSKTGGAGPRRLCSASKADHAKLRRFSKRFYRNEKLSQILDIAIIARVYNNRAPSTIADGPRSVSDVFFLKSSNNSGQVWATKSPCDNILMRRPLSSTTGKCRKRSSDIILMHSITSSSTRAVLGLFVIMLESGVRLGSRFRPTNRRTISRSVTMPRTFISSSTIITEPIFFSAIALTAAKTVASPPKATAGGLFANSGRSLIFTGLTLLDSGAKHGGLNQADFHVLAKTAQRQPNENGLTRGLEAEAASRGHAAVISISRMVLVRGSIVIQAAAGGGAARSVRMSGAYMGRRRAATQAARHLLSGRSNRRQIA